jgi:predicted MFS family arabinose efflux permease
MSSQSSSGISDRAQPPALLNVAVFAAGVATFVNMYCTQSILPELSAAFHVTPARTGLTVTAPLLATALVAPLVGAISDRFGRKKLIFRAALLLVIPSTLLAFAQNFDTLVLLRFVQGLMLPFIFTVTVAYIADETEGSATVRLAGTYMAGTISGGFSGRMISGLATAAFGWRVALLLVAVMTLAMALAIALLMRPERRFKAVYGLRRALQSFPQHLANKRLLATYAAGFGMLFSLVAVFTFVNFRLAAPPYGLGPAALGAVFVVYLGGVVMSPLAARLAGRFGRRRVMAAACPAMLAGLAVTLASPLWVIIAGLLLTCSAIFVQQTVATGFIGPAAGQAKSTAVGLYVTFYYIGGSCGGIAPAGLWRDYGWPGCVALVALMQLIVLAVVSRWWVLKTER